MNYDLGTLAWMCDWHFDIWYDLAEMQGMKLSEKCKCKKCGEMATHRSSGPSNHFKCGVCGNSWSPLTDTIFTHSKMLLPVWLKAIMLLKCRNDITLDSMCEALSVSNVTASSMRRKIRTIVDNPHSLEMRIYRHYFTDIIGTKNDIVNVKR